MDVLQEGVAEAVAGGAREDEVCYRAAFSKHELRRLLAMYPAHEGDRDPPRDPALRKSLHRLYRTVEKQLSEEGGLLQVVWRAMQEEFIAQHRALQVGGGGAAAGGVARHAGGVHRAAPRPAGRGGGGLLQVVWRAMQEEFIAQHRALQVGGGGGCCRWCGAPCRRSSSRSTAPCR
ncbi:hypothetical protein MSG28_009928 [Choristoneura fumiferana]|uniref:Uncharacterized protein n=1 Tax=Choristoneura fumiferana TaxID=7141 RepID=A0ACC0JD58_CHOFU|nr:hypothetical protein MSG28_009928 [Choristoneura fumiferana]